MGIDGLEDGDAEGRKPRRAVYGDFQALFGIDFDAAKGEIVALIGANGAGKSTFLQVHRRADARRSGGESASTATTSARWRRTRSFAAASRWSPEGRRLFPSA